MPVTDQKYTIEQLGDSDSEYSYAVEPSIEGTTPVDAPSQTMMYPKEDHNRLTSAQVLVIPNAATGLFNLNSKENDALSRGAIWGSASDDGLHHLITYTRRWKRSIDGQKKFFAAIRDDKLIKVVQNLLPKWAVEDEPVVFDDETPLSHG
jgi:hypothetical protein